MGTVSVLYGWTTKMTPSKGDNPWTQYMYNCYWTTLKKAFEVSISFWQIDINNNNKVFTQKSCLKHRNCK